MPFVYIARAEEHGSGFAGCSHMSYSNAGAGIKAIAQVSFECAARGRRNTRFSRSPTSRTFKNCMNTSRRGTLRLHSASVTQLEVRAAPERFHDKTTRRRGCGRRLGLLDSARAREC